MQHGSTVYMNSHMAQMNHVSWSRCRAKNALTYKYSAQWFESVV